MNGLTKSMAQFGAPYNIRCNCIAPGPVLTRPDMANMKTLAGRAAEPIEIINAFLYLASDEGAFINGETLLMDGGRNVMFNKY
jgi:NAD(P)-dependent dehydrogenase (short-subunit alcohol dehydrogenase family)